MKPERNAGATQWGLHAPLRRRKVPTMNPMSLLTMPPALLRERFNNDDSDNDGDTLVSHGERHERPLALAIGLVAAAAALVIAFF
jgi:hypothetical protein